MTLKLEMLRIFQIVADEGSLSRAATRLGRTPSAVSMTLSQLQDELGAELFETERKSRLTPSGALVLAEANCALNAFDRSVWAIRRHARSTAGLVRVAAVPSATLTPLPEVIVDFRRQRPDVRLEISDVDTANVQWRVKFDQADIGIVSTAPGDDQVGVAIQRDALGIVCRAGGAISQAFRAGAPASWDLLAHEPLIDNPLCHLVKSPIVANLLLQCTIEARNTSALLAFVGSGLGAIVLPERAIYRDSERLEFIVADDPESWRLLSKIHSQERHLSPAALAVWQSIPAMDKKIRHQKSKSVSGRIVNGRLNRIQ